MSFKWKKLFFSIKCQNSNSAVHRTLKAHFSSSHKLSDWEKKEKKRNKANTLEFRELVQNNLSDLAIYSSISSVRWYPLSPPIDQGRSRPRRPSYLVIAADGALAIQRSTLWVGRKHGKHISWTSQGWLWLPLIYLKTSYRSSCLLCKYQFHL